MGLGCENNNIGVFKEVLGEVSEKRVKFLNVQDVEDELEEGVRLINELKAYADTFKREPIPVSELKLAAMAQEDEAAYHTFEEKEDAAQLSFL